ncbi:hypothetical protein TWF751_005186 [Orbilia oligospora]|nr:hypothetical protein TWF751_005186 [Orbilia oligospora]
MEPFNISAEMTSLLDSLGAELPAFIRLQQETLENGPANDERIELYIYVCFLAFKNVNSIEHLEQAIRQAGRWTAGLGTDHSDLPRRVQILNFLSDWMIQLELISELDTKELGQATSPRRAHQKQNLAIKLFKKYEETGVLRTLNEAIDVMLQNLGLVGEHITPGMLSNFGVMLGTRFNRTGSMDDLNRAVEAVDIAVTATHQDHPDQANRLSNLGNQLKTRFHRTGSIDDTDRALSLHQEAWRCQTASPSARIESARLAALILASQ